MTPRVRAAYFAAILAGGLALPYVSDAFWRAALAAASLLGIL